MPATVSETSDQTSRISWVVIGIILLVFASALVLVTRHLRSLLVPQIIQQDGIALGAALLMSPSLTQELDEDLANDPEIIFAGLENIVLGAAQQRDEVFGVRMF